MAAILESSRMWIGSCSRIVHMVHTRVVYCTVLRSAVMKRQAQKTVSHSSGSSLQAESVSPSGETTECGSA
jgi:hypothetical protein